ncbi:VOC family protein [Rhizohabitans arisaemae]|uniref:VOC family protein n=1 Tax=Rhizohabitans arisaemae TaxID=2720610 RepID=UPI0024B1F784|nr:VOC family protein [Rhizohabitans arisaemae]
MVQVSAYEPGMPCWVDLSSPDLPASVEFYSALFGWEVAMDPRPEAGGYGLFTLRGLRVAGIGPMFQQETPPVWNTYVSCGDIRAVTTAVRDHGGYVFMEPMRVLTEGDMAVFADPNGAVFLGWQPRANPGAQLVNEPGTWCWNELETRDEDTAREFYSAVFGWGFRTGSAGGFDYTEWLLGDRPVGGMMPMGSFYPPEVPPHWMTYFHCADSDATAARAVELGAEVLLAPMDTPAGRVAMLADPHRAAFSVIAGMSA